MADCFPPESDDLQRRWLPREIFADIGIVDVPEPAATEPAPEAAAADADDVEELAAQLAGILGGGAKLWPLAPAPTPAPPTAAPCHAAQVCGLQGGVVSCGVTNGVGAGAAVSWPFVPYPPLQWQVGSSMMNHGGVLDYQVLPPALPCHLPPPANLRSGTGVFLPRVDAYRYATAPPAPAKGGPAAKTWAGTASTSARPATGKKQERQQAAEQATPPLPQPPKQLPQATTSAALALALPQDWSYRC